GLEPGAAFRRSATLVRGHWVEVLIVMGLGLIAAALVQLLVHAVFAILSLLLGGGLVERYLRLFAEGVISQILTVPFLAVLVVLVYFSVRARQEGIAPEHVAKAVESEGG